MGKGDKKTKRGKLFMGSYGRKRLRNKKPVVPMKASAPKPAKKVEKPVIKEEPKPETVVVEAPVAEKTEVEVGKKVKEEPKAVKEPVAEKPAEKAAPAAKKEVKVEKKTETAADSKKKKEETK